MGSFKRIETTRITWTLEELTELVNDESSHVYLENTRRHIALHPYQLNNWKQSLQDVLGGDINYYDDELEGLFLSYKNPKLLSEKAAMLNDTFSCHVDIEADFYVFRPKVGHVLKGIINKKAVNHLGVLVHKAFNVSLPRRDEEEEYWHGDQLDAGDEVTFTVELMDLKPGRGKLPFIRGKLMLSDETSVPNSDEDNENGEISRIDGKKPKFSSTVNESNSSESEGERVESSVKRGPQVGSDSDGDDDTVTQDRIKSSKGKIRVDSSDDSDEETEVSSKKNSSEKKRNIEQSSDDSEDEADTTIKKLSQEDSSIFYKSKNIKKSSGSNEKSSSVNGVNSTKGKIQVPSSDDSDADFPVFNKSIKKESPKKIVQSRKIQEQSDGSDDESPIFNKSSEKTRKESVNQQDLDSDVDVPIFNKSKNIEKNSSPAKSKKEVNNKKKFSNGKSSSSDDSDDQVPFANKSIQKSSKRIPQNSEHSEDDVPVFNNSIKQESPKKVKRKHSESENSVNVGEPSKKSKKHSKKLRNDDDEVSDNTSKPKIINDQVLNSPRKTPQKRKGKPAHDISSSDDSETENNRKKSIKVQRELKKKNPNNEMNKSTKNKINSTNDDDDSEDDFASFMLAQKIEEENDLETSRITKKESESKSKVSVSPKKKSKKSSENGEADGDSIQMLLHAERIKPEGENKIKKVEDSDSDISKRDKKEKKKWKKSKQSEIVQEEDTLKIKEEKKKLSVQSDKIVNLQEEEDSDAEFDSLTADLRVQEAENHKSSEFVKKVKNGKREKESKSEKSKKKSQESEESRNIAGMSPPPPRPLIKAKKHKSSKTKQSSTEENGELSDASSTKSRILVQREESVFFGNIKIKQEPYASDVESISSRKRKRKDSTRSSSERNDTFDNIRIKRESSVVKSESKKNRRNSENDSSIKSEVNGSDLDDAPPKKKSKKKFDE